jgi:hypothetical protein
MASFPSDIIPTVTQGYSFGAADNVISQPVAGGLPLSMLDYRTAAVPISVGFVCDAAKLLTFQTFYYSTINSGADAFNMELDTGRGIETHVVKIAPSSVSIDGSREPIWTISMQLLIEKLPIQG